MRVIAGTARSLKLETVESMDTRPTTDRIKETLFNMINYQLPGCSFLDLFSGSGAIAIEALSRGADRAYLVEQNRKAVDCINRNLKFTHLDSKASVIVGDVISSIDRIEKNGICFDFVFMDPPYGKLYEQKVLERLADSTIIDSDTIIIVESDLNTTYDYIDDLGFEEYKTKIYKTNKHTFFNRRQI
ncbi:MAG: 16S rRNA (guanine(966)-N(2))-methyltransferase RsmD [Coprococcus sp.]